MYDGPLKHAHLSLKASRGISAATGTTTPAAITVTGANFVPTTVVQINGASRTRTYVSSTRFLSTLSVADQATAGSLSVTALTPAGWRSFERSLHRGQQSLAWIYQYFSRRCGSRSQEGHRITVIGTGFVPGTSIKVNGSARATTCVDASQLTFVLLAADTAAAGRLTVVPSSVYIQPSTYVAAQIGSVTLRSPHFYNAGGVAPVAPDLSLGQVFFGGNTTSSYFNTSDGLLS